MSRTTRGPETRRRRGGHAQAAGVALVGGGRIRGLAFVGDALEATEQRQPPEVGVVDAADFEHAVRADVRSGWRCRQTLAANPPPASWRHRKHQTIVMIALPDPGAGIGRAIAFRHEAASGASRARCPAPGRTSRSATRAATRFATPAYSPSQSTEPDRFRAGRSARFRARVPGRPHQEPLAWPPRSGRQRQDVRVPERRGRALPHLLQAAVVGPRGAAAALRQADRLWAREERLGLGRACKRREAAGRALQGVDRRELPGPGSPEAGRQPAAGGRGARGGAGGRKRRQIPGSPSARRLVAPSGRARLITTMNVRDAAAAVLLDTSPLTPCRRPPTS